MIISIKNYKKSLTKEDLIFLHLLENNSNQHRYIVSELLTQKGIQSKINCDLSLISRILKKNEKKGYIYRSLKKIKNKKRKQNAFYLSDEGMERAEELHNRISGLK